MFKGKIQNRNRTNTDLYNEYEKLKSASTQPKIVHVVADKAVVSTIVLTK